MRAFEILQMVEEQQATRCALYKNQLLSLGLSILDHEVKGGAREIPKV